MVLSNPKGRLRAPGDANPAEGTAEVGLDRPVGDPEPPPPSASGLGGCVVTLRTNHRFSGVLSEADRHDILAYLETL